MSSTKRTPQQASKDSREAREAWENGKQIQARMPSKSPEWADLKNGTDICPRFTDWSYEFRVKPTPRLRPWKPEEVPVGALIRSKKYSTEHRWMIVGWNVATLFTSNTALGPVDFDDCLSDFEHSLDNGKTWAPCGVQEGGE